MTNSKQMDLDLSTLSLEDILANHSPKQVEKRVSKIRDTSGQSILGLSKSVGLLSSLEKTLVDILNSVLTPCSRTWRVKVTPQGRLVFQLLASAPTTKEKESGLWQTPTAVGINQRSQEALERKRKKRLAIGRATVPPGSLMEQIQLSPNKNQKPRWNLWRTPDNLAGGSNLPGIQRALDEGHLKRPSGQPIQIRLHDQVREPRLWPTPTATERSGINPKTGKGAGLSKTIQTWPTPQHTDHLMNQSEMIEAWKKRATEKKKQGINLQFALRHAVQTWPTPREFMYKDSTTDRGKGNLGEKVGGQLNPTWVEWLMGYPPGWTDLKH